MLLITFDLYFNKKLHYGDFELKFFTLYIQTEISYVK